MWPARFALKFAFLSVARSFRSQIFNTGPIHEQGRRQDFSLGAGGCRRAKRVDASNPSAQRANRASCGRGLGAQPPAGSRGGAPWRGAQPPGNFLRNRVF